MPDTVQPVRVSYTYPTDSYIGCRWTAKADLERKSARASAVIVPQISTQQSSINIKTPSRSKRTKWRTSGGIVYQSE